MEIDEDPTYSICTESSEDEEETKTSYDESESKQYHLVCTYSYLH